jgi:hypothetical protein
MKTWLYLQKATRSECLDFLLYFHTHVQVYFMFFAITKTGEIIHITKRWVIYFISVICFF